MTPLALRGHYSLLIPKVKSELLITAGFQDAAFSLVNQFRGQVTASDRNSGSIITEEQLFWQNALKDKH